MNTGRYKFTTNHRSKQANAKWNFVKQKVLVSFDFASFCKQLVSVVIPNEVRNPSLF